MIRTTVSFNDNEYAAAQAAAQSLGLSLAEFIRRALREALRPRGEGPWMQFAGFVETGNPRSSQSVDGVVYGRQD